MKKISLLLIILITSCNHHPEQRVRLDFDFNHGESVFSEKKYEIELSVIDERKDHDAIGEKYFGEEKITIISDTNLSNTIKTKLAQGLANQGFYLGKGKIVELHIQTLSYVAKREFFIGTSEAKSDIGVVVRDTKNNAEFSKNYKLSAEKKHFLAPLKSTDDETINFVIKETLEDMLKDEELLGKLK